MLLIVISVLFALNVSKQSSGFHSVLKYCGI